MSGTCRQPISDQCPDEGWTCPPIVNTTASLERIHKGRRIGITVDLYNNALPRRRVCRRNVQKSDGLSALHALSLGFDDVRRRQLTRGKQDNSPDLGVGQRRIGSHSTFALASGELIDHAAELAGIRLAHFIQAQWQIRMSFC